MEILIRGDEMETVEDFHACLKNALHFPDYYGGNLDALWDCLKNDVEKPLTIIWKDFKKSQLKLGAFADRALSVFKDAEKEIEGFQIQCHS